MRPRRTHGAYPVDQQFPDSLLRGNDGYTVHISGFIFGRPLRTMVTLSSGKRDCMSEGKARAIAWLTAWDSQGIHRAATAGDAAGAEWLTREVADLGAAPALEEFVLDRLDPVEAYLELDGTQIRAVSVFDAPPPVRTVSPAFSGRLASRPPSLSPSCRRLASIPRITKNCAAMRSIAGS